MGERIESLVLARWLADIIPISFPRIPDSLLNSAWPNGLEGCNRRSSIFERSELVLSCARRGGTLPVVVIEQPDKGQAWRRESRCRAHLLSRIGACQHGETLERQPRRGPRNLSRP